MIVYQRVLEKLSDAGYSAYRIRKENLISGSTLDRIRKGLSVSTETINTICRLCGCQPGELIKYEPDTGD